MSEGIRVAPAVADESVASCCGGECFPLAHPALTALPEELQPPGNRGENRPGLTVSGAVDVRRLRGLSSDSSKGVAAWAWRAVESKDAVELRERLRRGIAQIESDATATLLDLVCDGTLGGWKLRIALSSITGEAVANWDVSKGRSQVERLAVLERALREITEAMPRGGWVVAP